MELQLPFLITSLVSHDRQVSSVVAAQVQWLEKLFGDVERAILNLEKTSTMKQGVHVKKWEPKELKLLYDVMKPWNYDFQ